MSRGLFCSISLLLPLLVVRLPAKEAGAHLPLALAWGAHVSTVAYDFSGASSDTLPPLALLHAAIDTFHVHATRAPLLELQESRRGNWLKHLPTLGLAHTPTGAPRPGLSYSTAVIYQAKKDKQARATKRLAILQQALLDAQRDKEALRPLLERHTSLLHELATATLILELDRELLSYWQQGLAAKNIGPVEFLEKKKAFLEKEASLARLRDRLRELKAEVLARAHYFSG